MFFKLGEAKNNHRAKEILNCFHGNRKKKKKKHNVMIYGHSYYGKAIKSSYSTTE